MSLNSVAQDIVTLLDQGVPDMGTSGVNIFPFEWGTKNNGDEVNKQILVRHTDDVDNGHKTEHEQPTFNILVRGLTSENYIQVHDRARVIFEFMSAQVRQTLNGTEYIQFTPQGGLIPIGKDNSSRVVFSMNFYTFRKSS